MIVPTGPRNSRGSGVSVRECQSVTRPGPGDVAKSELSGDAATAFVMPGGGTRPASVGPTGSYPNPGGRAGGLL